MIKPLCFHKTTYLITEISQANTINDVTTFTLPPLTGITMFKHNTLDLFWIGDGGFLSNYTNSGTIISDTGYPFATNVANFPVSKKYGYAGNGYTAGSMDVYNSVIFANVMSWAIIRSEFYGINTL